MIGRCKVYNSVAYLILIGSAGLQTIESTMLDEISFGEMMRSDSKVKDNRSYSQRRYDLEEPVQIETHVTEYARNPRDYPFPNHVKWGFDYEYEDLGRAASLKSEQTSEILNVRPSSCSHHAEALGLPNEARTLEFERLHCKEAANEDRNIMHMQFSAQPK